MLLPAHGRDRETIVSSFIASLLRVQYVQHVQLLESEEASSTPPFKSHSFDWAFSETPSHMKKSCVARLQPLNN